MAYTIPYAAGWKDLPLQTTPITAATLNAISDELASYNAAWTSFTPSWVSLTPGDGTNEGVYTLIGRLAIIRFAFTFGSTSSVSSSIVQAVPSVRGNIRTSPARTGYHPFGVAYFYDASANTFYHGVVNYNGSNTVRFHAFGTGGSYSTFATMNATVPVAYGVGDVLAGQYMYETAS